MENFEFFNPVKILFGKGQIAKLRGAVPAGARLLVTYGSGSIKRNGVYDQVMANLQGHTVSEFSGIEPNPAYETLMKAVEVVKRERIDFLLAVGCRPRPNHHPPRAGNRFFRASPLRRPSSVFHRRGWARCH